MSTTPTTDPTDLPSAGAVSAACKLDPVFGDAYELGNNYAIGVIHHRARLIDRETHAKAMEDACQSLLDALHKHGEWDDGCFYFGGVSATHMESSIKNAMNVIAMKEASK